MVNIYKFWIDQGFDAFRIDTVKHVDHGFWQSWCPQIRQHAIDIGKPDFFMFGEVADQSETKNGSYTGTKNGGGFELDSVLDYPLYYAINNVFALGTGNTKLLDDHFAARAAYYDPGALSRLVTFVDNHDQSRFVAASNSRWAQTRLALALTFIYSTPGVPCLYYGTEQGFNGGNDPNNREDMFAGQFEPGYASRGDNFNMGHWLFQHVALLNSARRNYPALRSGSFTSLANNSGGPGIYAYSRRLGAQELVVILNSSEADQQIASNVPLSYAPSTTLVNIFDFKDKVTVSQNGTFPMVYIPALAGKIFIVQSQAIPLDPLVVSITPVHDAKTVSPTSKINLSFTKPMDRPSVEAAFSTVPATTGRFTWDSGNQSVIYQAIGGLAGSSTIEVHIDVSATDTDAKHLYAPFVSRFTTAAAGAADSTPPTVTIVSPQNGAVVNGNGIQVAASDDSNIDKVEQQLDDGAWVPSYPPYQFYSPAKTVSWYAYLQLQYLPNGWHTMAFRATDAYGNMSDPVSISVRFFTRPGIYEKWLVANNGNTVDCSGHVWESEQPYDVAQTGSNSYNRDYGYVGGIPARSYNYISNVCDREQVIYQNERYTAPLDTLRYLFKCPPGVYEVTVHDAETFMSGPNQRLFDIFVQGVKKFANIDLFSVAGGANRAVTFTSQTTAPNGLLEVQLKPVYDNARISGVHLQKTADIVSDSDGIADWWRLGSFGHATGLAADQSQAGDDPDHDGMTNYEEFLAGTDGSDPSSVLKITGFDRSGYDLVITFNSNTDKYYDVQQTDRLDTPNWTTYASHQPGTGPNRKISINGGVLPGTPPKCYRIVLSPQQ
jgi:hypothetical protein